MKSLTDILIGIPTGTQDLINLEVQKKTKVKILKKSRHGVLVQEIAPKEDEYTPAPRTRSSSSSTHNDLLSVFSFPGVFRQLFTFPPHDDMMSLH